MGKSRKFDHDFRRGAVRIVLETGTPIAQVARALGVNEGTPGTWVATAREAGGPDGAVREPERAEPARLRRDNAELRMRREALKRSLALRMDEAMGGGGGREAIAGAIRHPDQGAEHASGTGRAARRRLGITQPSGRPGSALDNAAIEAGHSPGVRAAPGGALRHPRPGPPGVAAFIDAHDRHRRHGSIA